MKVDYICDYLHNSGYICGKACLVLKVVDCTIKLGCAGRALFVASLPGQLVDDVVCILGDIIKSYM